MPFVVDSSVTIAWILPDESDTYADRVLDALKDETAHAPSNWPTEVANVLIVSSRRGRVSITDALHYATIITQLEIVVDVSNYGALVPEVLSIAHETGLSAYDAAYLELCLRLNLPLATLDERLRVEAVRKGIPAYVP